MANQPLNEYAVGQQITMTAEFKNEKGELVNPTTVTFKVLDHNGNQTNYTSPANPSTGKFTQTRTIVASEAGGDTEYRAEGTGAAIGAEQNSYRVKPDHFA